ncbi:MAG: PEP-CTERM sorting domain-containing protein [Armatimonadota bacterium]|nr:PEP-CTERM sorting domain-containing protein [bacterium]
MKMITRALKMTAIVAASAAIIVAQTPGFAANFSDDFNRADSSTVGNGWTVGANGNGGGNNTPPIAGITGGQLVLSRAGWGSDGDIAVEHALDAVTSIQLDMSWTLAEKGNPNADLSAIGAGGAYVMVRSFQSGSGKSVSVSLSNDGGWHDWITYGDYVDTTGVSTYKISTTGSQVTVDVLSGDSVLWSRSYAFALQSINEAAIKGNWAGWEAGGNIYADNFAATTAAVPEPSSLLALASVLPLAFLRRRR